MSDYTFSPASAKQEWFLTSEANIIVYGGEFSASIQNPSNSVKPKRKDVGNTERRLIYK